MDPARVRDLPGALLELMAAMSSGNATRKTAARAALNSIINS